jgi:SnoaL-like domain
MLKRPVPVAIAAGVGMLVLVTARAQSKGPQVSALTPWDYIQIQQLVNRYPYAVDTGAQNGDMYAGLFASDGTFGQRTGDVQGKDALAAVARRFQRGPQSTFHFLMDHVIEPSPEGAVGKEYLAQFVFGDNGQPSRIFGGGHYDDVYEKTADGWRFKRRQFIPSQSGFETTTPTASIGPLARIAETSGKHSTLTVSDYVEIQQLISRYPYGLDTGADSGNLFAAVFAPDGAFAGGPSRVEGREKLAAFASGHRPGQGPLYTRNFSTNVVIRPSPEGAVGKIYAAVLDIGEGAGKPSSVLNGGHYEDVYVRTPEGWRIKSRQFLPSRSGDQAAPIESARLPVKVARDPGPQPKTKGSQAALAPEDYIEIQQVVASYPFALDTGADSGALYADLFTTDGMFVSGDMKIAGRESLKAFAWHHRPGQGPLYVRNFSTNSLIEPSAGGATGKAYALVLDLGENGKPSSLLGGGHYEDVYVKTADGWRIKRREFIPSKTELPPPPPRTGR